MIAKGKGFSLIELVVALFISAFVMIVFAGLFRSTLVASNRGQVDAQVTANVRIALEQVGKDLRQAAPIPGGHEVSPPAVIVPGPGGIFNDEPAFVGCTLAACLLPDGKSTLKREVIAPPKARVQSPAGPTGFLVFSVLKPPAGGLTKDPSYLLDPRNYTWVMYQVNPPGDQPARLVRFTFPVTDALGNLRGIVPIYGGWTRDDTYFVPLNSNEAGTDPDGIPVVTLSQARDQMWFMVSHNGLALGSATSEDPELFNITGIVNQYAMANAEASQIPKQLVTAVQIKLEGAGL